MKIKKLSSKLIKQIAAGEVVQKPYNIVKELVENSIDANATEISIYVTKNVLDKIVIIDNGNGFEKEDLLIATQLHTTSKTQETDEIFGMNFLGFRGEALAAIDSIANLTLESGGYKILNENLSNSNVEKGSKITVENIFHSVPARMKFVKNLNLEFNQIKEVVKKYVLIFPNVLFNFYFNGKLMWNFANLNKEQKIEKLFEETPLKIEKSLNNVSVCAYVFKKAKVKYLIINNRPVSNKEIFAYIGGLFKEYNLINEQSGYVLFITMDPLFLDYNVHPSKDEIKIFNHSALFSLLSEVFNINYAHSHVQHINNSILESISNFQQKNEESNDFLMKRILSEPISFRVEEPKDFVNFNEPKFKYTSIKSDLFSEKTEKEEKQFSGLKIVGQIFASYIVFEIDDKVGVFDQHASYERILYEQMKKSLNQSNMQNLLLPINLNLSFEQIDFLQNNEQEFLKKGILIQNNALLAVPMLTINIVSEIVKMLETECNYNVENEVNRLLADIACKNALKANTILSNFEMLDLLNNALKNPPVCNHGRSVFKYYFKKDLENLFDRK